MLYKIKKCFHYKIFYPIYIQFISVFQLSLFLKMGQFYSLLTDAGNMVTEFCEQARQWIGRGNLHVIRFFARGAKARKRLIMQRDFVQSV